jgi:hypothetical protein
LGIAVKGAAGGGVKTKGLTRLTKSHIDSAESAGGGHQ